MLRIQSDALVTPESRQRRPSDGEWLSLEHSNELLSQRFGYRKRPYVVHEAKSASTVLLREMMHTYPAAFDATGHNRFRATPAFSQRDIHPFFMFAHYVVERWREAALWAWVVARSPGRGEKWLDAAWEEISGPGAKDNATLTVRSTRRRTLDPQYVQEMLGGEGNIGTSTYDFCMLPSPSHSYRMLTSLPASKDGYPYSSLGASGTKKWPDMQSATGTAADELKHPHFKCTISRATCFAGASDPAALFARVAFEQPECGDCSA